MPNFPFFEYFSRFEKIYIELEDYKFYHSPFSNSLETSPDSGTNDEYNQQFIGRDKVKSRLRMILSNSFTKSGAYLVTGFRGMGKTSLVRQVISEINKESKANHSCAKYIPIEISLAQDDLKDIDVLRQVSRQLLYEFKGLENGKPKTEKLADISKKTRADSAWYRFNKWINYNLSEKARFKRGYEYLYNRMIDLNLRITAEVKREKTGRSFFQKKSPYNSNYEEELTNNTGKYEQGFSQTKNFPIIGSKDIEWELIKILEGIDELRQDGWLLPEFLFVFDELDKIEPYHKLNLLEKEAEDPVIDTQRDNFISDKSRVRRETIAQMLANMKNFLNVARAKFIFIGGREMYDASLADIADRDSFYSSIFHDVLYVGSFLKDKIKTRSSGISSMIEAYLCKMLIPRHYREKLVSEAKEKKTDFYHIEQFYTLKNYRAYLQDTFKDVSISEGIHNENILTDYQISRSIFLLQNFVIYLTFRSNGTPKKLVSLCEDYMVRKELGECRPEKNIIIHRRGNKQNLAKEQSIFLYFNYDNQYEICLTSSIYRPYLISKSRHIKSLGDKILYSTSFIIDHILKFHSFGFSWRNLELIPEIIMINKTPQLRGYIEEIIDFFSNTYIRPTVGGVFQFKFFNKFSNEIKYISKLSELSSAAFNFTLDESLMIKRHYRKKLAQLKNQYHSYQSKPNKAGFVHSIGFVYTILGDLHYYDKEYDDAIIQYADSIQHLRDKIRNKNTSLSKHQAVLLIINKLKLALTLEKIRSFESAFAVFEELISDIPFYFHDSKDQRNVVSTANNSVFKRLSLITQTYLASLHILEKMRVDGITDADLRRNEQSFYLIIDTSEPSVLKAKKNSIPPKELPQVGIYRKIKGINLDSDHECSLISNYFNNIGSILFFKNANMYWQLRNLHQVDTEYKKLAGFNNGNFNWKEKGEEFKERHTLKYFHEYLNILGEGVSDYNPSFSAYINYRESLRWFLKRFRHVITPTRRIIRNNPEFYKEFPLINKDEKSTQTRHTYLCDLLILISRHCPHITNSQHLYDLGNLLSKTGDAILSIISKQSGNFISISQLEQIFSSIEILDEKEEANGFTKELRTKITQELGEAYLRIINEQDVPQSKMTQGTSIYYNMGMVFFTYRLASLFYLRAGRTYSYAFQLKKSLYVIKDHLAVVGKEDEKSAAQEANNEPDANSSDEGTNLNRGDADKLLSLLRDKVALEIIKAVTWEFDVANRPQILKYKDIFDLERNMKGSKRREIYRNVSTSTEILEVKYLISEIELKICRNGKILPEKLDLPVGYNQISSLSYSSKFARMMELKYKTDLNQQAMHNLGFSKILVDWGDAFLKEQNKANVEPEPGFFDIQEYEDVFYDKWKKTDKSKRIGECSCFLPKDFEPTQDSIINWMEFLIIDSIYCLTELIRIQNIFGINYMTNYTYLAATHRKMGRWCHFYRTILRVQKGRDKDKSIHQKLSDNLGQDSLYYLEINYHYELAVNYYYSAIQMHKEGRAYKQNVHKTFFLEDDCNDNLYHFCASLERYKINTGNIRSTINHLKERIKESKLYNYESYVE